MSKDKVSDEKQQRGKKGREMQTRNYKLKNPLHAMEINPNYAPIQVRYFIKM
jgi:hypothetical protein